LIESNKKYICNHIFLSRDAEYEISLCMQLLCIVLYISIVHYDIVRLNNYVASISRWHHHASVRGTHTIANDIEAEATQGKYSTASILRRRGRLRRRLRWARKNNGRDFRHLGHRSVFREYCSI